MPPRKENNTAAGPTTWFASPGRAEDPELVRQITLVSTSPVVDAVLTSLSGLLAVLNEDRQILAINDSFFHFLGITDPAEVLGLRPGEALQCEHSGDNEAGCGTGEYCATCGMAIAVVTSLTTTDPVERKCILTTKTADNSEDFCFRVKTSLLGLDDNRFVLVFLQDISDHERTSELSRIFCHDIRNMIMGLGCTIEQLGFKEMQNSPRLHEKIRRLSENLTKEVKIQSAIANNRYHEFPLAPVSCSPLHIIRELRDIFASEPAAQGKILTIWPPMSRVRFTTDPQLLVRVLTNMLLNAFEATEEGGEVRFWMKVEGPAVSFHVWNRSMVPDAVQKRVFQRFFSTKQESGRGLGTFCMKLLGEKLLGGSVGFTTSKEGGTVFRLSLPRK